MFEFATLPLCLRGVLTQVRFGPDINAGVLQASPMISAHYAARIPAGPIEDELRIVLVDYTIPGRANSIAVFARVPRGVRKLAFVLHGSPLECWGGPDRFSVREDRANSDKLYKCTGTSVLGGAK